MHSQATYLTSSCISPILVTKRFIIFVLEGGEVGCLASSQADELVEESERYEMEEEHLHS